MQMQCKCNKNKKKSRKCKKFPECKKFHFENALHLQHPADKPDSAALPELKAVYEANSQLTPQQLIQKRRLICKIITELEAATRKLNGIVLSKIHPHVRGVLWRYEDDGSKRVEFPVNIVDWYLIKDWMGDCPDPSVLQMMIEGNPMVGVIETSNL